VAEHLLARSPRAMLHWAVENKTGFVAQDLYVLLSRNAGLAAHSRYLRCVQGRGRRQATVYGIPTSAQLKVELRSTVARFLDAGCVHFAEGALWTRGVDAAVQRRQFVEQFLNFAECPTAAGGYRLSGKHAGPDDLVMAFFMLVYGVGRPTEDYVRCASVHYSA
jgi:hypothetical protein